MKALEKAFEVAVASLLAAVVVIVLIEITARYFLKISLSWPEELARYTLVWLTFVGAAVGVATRRMIVTQAFTALLPKPVRHWLRIATTLLGLAAIGITLWAMIPLQFGPAGRTASSATGIQLKWVYLALPVGGFAIMGFLVRDLIDLLRGHSVEPKLEEAVIDEYSRNQGPTN